MKRLILFRSRSLVLGSLVLLLACSSPRPAPVPRLVMSLAIVVDASTSSSVREGQQIADLRCPEVSSAVERALSHKGLRQLDVLIVASGGKATSSEGRVVAPWRSFTPTARLFGRRVSPQEQRQAFINNLEAECRSTLHPEKSSPIFFAIERAAESLRQHTPDVARGSEVVRQLVVLSDLRENVHQGIKARLLAVSSALRKGLPIPKQPSTIPVLKLDGISLLACGLAEHAGGNADDLNLSPDAVTVVWQGVFQPTASFDAACPRPTARLVGGAR